MNTNQQAKRKWALVTGGTKGLGLAVAIQLAQQEANLILVYRRDEDKARASKELLQKSSPLCQCHLISCDLSLEGATEELFPKVKEITPELHYYVHNAAATAFKDLMGLHSHHIDKTFNLTVKSFILGMQHLVPMMERAGGGRVVTVSGMDTLKAVPFHGLLGAAKASLETLTNYFAHELAAKNIRVNGVNPGFLETESTQLYLGEHAGKIQKGIASTLPLKRFPRLEEVADVILYLLSDKASWILGQTLKVDGGQDFSLPSFMPVMPRGERL